MSGTWHHNGNGIDRHVLFVIFVFLFVKINFKAIIFYLFYGFKHNCIELGTLQKFCVVFWRFGKFWNPRWRLFWNYDVIVTWCDVIIPRDVYQKIDVRTCYISYKFYCDCFNILEVKNSPVGIGLNAENILWTEYIASVIAMLWLSWLI